MWFYPLIVTLVILAIAGATVGGGVFTIVLIPLAVIAAVAAVVYAMISRAAEVSAGASGTSGHGQRRPLPRRRRRPTGRAPSTPDGLVDARRQQQ